MKTEGEDEDGDEGDKRFWIHSPTRISDATFREIVSRSLKKEIAGGS